MAIHTMGHAIANDFGHMWIKLSADVVRKPMMMAETIMDVKKDITKANTYTRYRFEIFLVMSLISTKARCQYRGKTRLLDHLALTWLIARWFYNCLQLPLVRFHHQAQFLPNLDEQN
jgi:hypothetical protein